MLNLLVYGMVYLGSALMVYNIYHYIRYEREISSHGDWEQERRILRLPIFLLMLFLAGYLAVAFVGKPDLIISGILFGGSIFVAIMVYLMQRISNRIFENEKIEAELMAMEAANRAKTNFLSNMSHEMRTPMNVVLGLVRLMKDDAELSPQTLSNLDKIEASTNHLLAIINDVLDMSLIDAGRMTLREAPFSFGEVMLQFNSLVAAVCHEKGVTYNCERIGSVDDEFVGDATKLKQIMLSIADNAVKFTDAPGQVRCTVEQTASDEETRTLRFVVQDSGVGMDSEYLAHAFDAFSREDLSSTSTQAGTGLGLTITKHLVDMMNGTIGIESERGVGTTVTVTVVLKAAGAKPESTESVESQDDVSLEGRRILIVEDVDLNAEILADLLDMEGILSERAENGQVAVDLFQKSAAGYYDGILMDLRMPVMDGLEATRRIRALDRPDAGTIPILALTANAFEEDVQNSLAAGMNAHLPKPADIDMLCATLKKCMK